MAGRFLRRADIICAIKEEQRTNAWRKRAGLTRYPIRAYHRGSYCTICTATTIPTAEECAVLLKKKRQRETGDSERIQMFTRLRLEALRDTLASRPVYQSCRVSIVTHRSSTRLVVHGPTGLTASELSALRQIAAQQSLPFPSSVHVC